MLLLITAFAVFTGFHSNWIRQRRQALRRFDAQAMMEFRIRRLSSDAVIAYVHESNPQSYVAAPQMLRLFGDSGVCLIEVGTFNRDWREQVASAKRLFPEATVRPRAIDPSAIFPEWPTGMEHLEEDRNRILKSSTQP
jgi:hypothetical protein